MIFMRRLHGQRVATVGLICVVTTIWLVFYAGKAYESNTGHRRSEPNERRLWVADDTDLAREASDIVTTHEERPHTEAHQWAPFLRGLPRSVVVLAYQRTGSSHIATLFNNDRRAFYLYEPLDGVYSSIYGTMPGWNIPSDITSYVNGSERVIPRWEADAIGDVLKDIFTCNVNRLPVHLLTHTFWRMFYKTQTSAKSFANCLRRSGAMLSRCTSILRVHCPGRFGANWTQSDDCMKGLSPIYNEVQAGGYRSRRLKMATAGRRINNAKVKHTRPGSGRQTTPRQIQPRNVFQEYSRCLSDQAELVSPCLWHLYMACQSSDLRVVKTVRATMSEMDVLFQTLPNFRLVHVFRDPRGVVTSRRLSRTFHGIGSDAISEASIYCRDVLRDITMRKTLEARYPGRIIQIIYDDLIKSPKASFQKIYAFLNLTAPAHMTSFSNSTTTTSAEAWTQRLTWKIVKEVDVACRELYDVVGSSWQH